MTSLLIGFAGSPSSGKSSTAAKLFAALKDLGVNCELALEYCKGWAWDQRKVTPYSQFYFLGKQSYAESRLFNKVGIIISDSPTFLCGFYNEYNTKSTCLNPVCKEFYRIAENDGVKVLNFFLPRKKKYQKEGRFHTEEQSNKIAIELREWLDREAYPYEELDCPDEDRVDVIMERLKELTNNFEGMIDS